MGDCFGDCTVKPHHRFWKVDECAVKVTKTCLTCIMRSDHGDLFVVITGVD